MKIAVITNDDLTTWLFRRDLLKELAARNHEVILLYPQGEHVKRFEEMGIMHIDIPFVQYHDITNDIKVFFTLYKTIKRIKPDIVLCYTIKPNSYGSLAARLAGVKRIFSFVCGAGFAFFPTTHFKSRLSRFFGRWMYRIGGICSEKFFFLNKEDKQLFIKKRIVSHKKCIVIPGEGINLNDYNMEHFDQPSLQQMKKDLKINDDEVVVIMIGRIMWSKGIREFVETARIAQSWNSKTRFLLVGELNPNTPDVVHENYLETTSNFQWLGQRNDVEKLIAISDIVTLPSFYSEGLPRTLLEGMAMKKPLVTTDHVGCRDTVEHKKTGFLVPPHNIQAFADGVKCLVDNEELRKKYGEAGFLNAKNKFSSDVIIRKIREEVRL